MRCDTGKSAVQPAGDTSAVLGTVRGGGSAQGASLGGCSCIPAQGLPWSPLVSPLPRDRAVWGTWGVLGTAREGVLRPWPPWPCPTVVSLD